MLDLLEHHTIKETKYWKIFLDPDQKNLGTCIIILKREVKHLSDLNEYEWKEFTTIVKELENSLKKAFHSTLFNWGSFLDTAYTKNMSRNQIYWHVIPRYQSDVEFEGIIFQDLCFGESTLNASRASCRVSPSIRTKIISKIQENLNL